MLTPREHLEFLIEGESTRRFRGDSREEFMAWRAGFVEWLRGLLGRFESGRHAVDRPVETRVVLEREWHGVERTDVLFANPEYDLEIVGTVLQPPAEKRNGAGVLCQHGHGPFGRLKIIGDRENPECAELIDLGRYDVGLQLAQRGYTMLAIDLYNFGCREMTEHGVRDRCDAVTQALVMFGMCPMAILLSEVRLAISLLSRWPGVDPARIGMCGNSLGGRMTMLTTALDERVKAAVAASAINTYRDRIQRAGSNCGLQTIPGLLPGADSPEIFASIAPRPLQIQMGDRDGGVDREAAQRATAHIARCYETACAPDRYKLDRFDGGHAFDPGPLIEWFDKWLQDAG